MEIRRDTYGRDEKEYPLSDHEESDPFLRFPIPPKVWEVFVSKLDHQT